MSRNQLAVFVAVDAKPFVDFYSSQPRDLVIPEGSRSFDTTVIEDEPTVIKKERRKVTSRKETCYG